MRRAFSLLVLGLVSLTAGPLAADQVVLKDGRTLETKKPPEIRGRQAVLLLADGTLVSIPASEIDTGKTAAAAAKAAEAAKLPASAPVVARPPSLVDAANATREGKKASVVLTDQDVAAGELDAGGDKKAAGDGRVIVSNVSAKKGASGTTVTGSVQNVGEELRRGRRGHDRAGGRRREDRGERLRAALGGRPRPRREGHVHRAARYRGHRTEREGPAALAVEGEGGGQDRSGVPAGKAAAATGKRPLPPGRLPVPSPAPAATPAPALRSPDMAAPPASAPVGAPSKPGGGYVPQPSSNQPKPPGGA